MHGLWILYFLSWRTFDLGMRLDPSGGGQFKQALKQIIEAERQPIKNLEARKAKEESKMKLFQDFKSKFKGFETTLAEFVNFKKFREFKAELGDGESLMSVTLDKERVQPGSYSLRIEQLAERSSVMTNSFEDPNEANLGIGFVVAELPNGDTAEIYIDKETASLSGIANKINENERLPFRASVIQDQTNSEKPWRLIMTSKDDGDTKGVKFPELYFLDGEKQLYIDEDHDSQNARVTVDGFEIEAGSNKVPDFLQGVTANFKQANPDKPFTLTITPDIQKISVKMKTMVEQINGILEFINKQNQIDEKTDTSTTFAGDTGLQMIEFRLRNLLHEGFPVANAEDEGWHFEWLNQMGVEFAKNGLVSLDENKFNKALEKNFNGVTETISGPEGFASQLRQVISVYTRSNDGMLSVREQGMKTRIKAVDDQIAQKERNLERRTRNLTDQFARLETSVANMQQQQQYMSATLGGGGGLSSLIG